MEKVFRWKDKSGDELKITYSGNKTDNVLFQSNRNEGLDRQLQITFISKAGHSLLRTVTQEGRREIFNASDGQFLLVDQNTFNVIKEGYEQ